MADIESIIYEWEISDILVTMARNGWRLISRSFMQFQKKIFKKCDA